jgi:intracellular septation protein A
MSDPGAGGRGLAAAVADQFSFEQSIGGVRGLLESVVPIIVFTVVYSVTHSISTASISAVGISVAALILRIVTRMPVTPAISGLLGVALSAGIAWYTGAAINFFLMSIVKNIALGLLFAVSALVRWPVVGVMLGMMLREQFHWRTVPARLRVYQQATWLWAGMSAVRLAFQVPLYLHDQVGGLGVASVPLGLPLFGLVVLATWLIVRRVPVARPPEPPAEEPDPDDGPAAAGRRPDHEHEPQSRAQATTAADPV